MIYSLTGKVSMIDENMIVVDTGSMAFEVICSSYTAYKLSEIQEPQTVLPLLVLSDASFHLSFQKDIFGKPSVTKKGQTQIKPVPHFATDTKPR